MNAIVDPMLEGVVEFNRSVVGVPVPDKPTCLGRERAEWFRTAAIEELDEFRGATAAGHVSEAADALIDLVYFALGRLVEMGVPAMPVFDEVQRANMGKKRGELSKRPNSKGYDAVKPAGWKGPDHSWIDEITPADVENLRRRAKLRASTALAPAGNGAKKFSGNKPPLHLCPIEALEEMARAFEFGVTKYGAWNWTKGRPFADYVDAALRHVYAYQSGEDLDPESGHSHVGHALSSLAMLAGCMRLHPELDNRRSNG